MKRDELFEEKMKNINKKMLVMKECFFAMLNDDSILSKNYCNIIDMRLSINYVIFYGYNYLLNYANYDECVLFLEFRNKLKKTVNFKKELSLIYEFDECKCGYFNLINEKDVDDYDLFLAKMYYWLYASEIEKYIFVKKLKMYFIDKKTKISNKNFALFTFATFIKYGKNSTEFDELKYDFMWLYDKTIKGYPLIYYKQYANDIEKKLYDDFIQKEKEKQLIDKQKMRKFYYEKCCELNWNKKLIGEYAITNSLNKETLTRYAHDYMRETLGYEDDKIYSISLSQSFAQGRKNTQEKYFLVYDKLMNATTIDEYNELLSPLNVNKNTLKSRVESFVENRYNRLPKEEKDKIESSLIKKINAYFSSKDKEKLESKKNDISPSLSKNLELIKELLLTSYDKDTFCKKYNIESQNFNQILASIKRYDINLYNKCVTELKTREDKNNIESINMIKKLVYYLENGVNINGLVRKFDILDYYFLTDIPHYKIMDLPLQLKGKSLKLLKNFVEKNKDMFRISVDKVMNERNIYGCKFDENRKYIEGTGREITALEKEKIIEFFNEHNIPLLDKVYYTALRRYANANLCIENDIDIVRIRQKNKFNE